ncbi:MAG: hypothetical protein ACJAVO_001957 [Parvibaculaceae bacterium]|jgi:hypothetical protein
MHGFSFGVGLANRFFAWWSGWRAVFNFNLNQFHPSDALARLTEERASCGWGLHDDGRYREYAAGELVMLDGNGVQVSGEVTNLFSNPSNLCHAAWAYGANVSGSLVALGNPANLDQVTKVEVLSTSGYVFVRQSLTVIAGLHTVSAVVKKGNYPYVGLRSLTLGSTPYSVFDFDSAAFVHVPESVVETGAMPLADGWYLIWAVDDSPGGAQNAGLALTNAAGVTQPVLEGGEFIYVLWMDVTNQASLSPHAEGTRLADCPVLEKGVGENLLYYGAHPDEWSVFGATVTAELDGVVHVESGGGVEHRAITSARAWSVGVTYKGDVTYKVGTSGKALLVLNDTETTLVSAHLSGLAGSLMVTEQTGCVVDILEQRLDGDIYIITFEFTPAFAVAVPVLGVGPFSSVVGEGVIAVAAGLRQVVPWDEYDHQGDLHPKEFVFQGAEGFVTTDGWVGNGSSALSVVDGHLQVALTGWENPSASVPVAVCAGKVYAAEFSGDTGNMSVGTNTFFVRVGETEGVHDGPYLLNVSYDTPDAEVVLEAFFVASAPTLYFGAAGFCDAPGAYFDIHRASLRELKPGVVVEQRAAFGRTAGQHAVLLVDGNGNNCVELRRTSGGAVSLCIRKEGATLYEAASATNWPDDVEATFRLEVTGTDGGTYFSVFLNEVYLADLSPGALDYPNGIDRLSLAAMAGVKTIQSLKVH